MSNKFEEIAAGLTAIAKSFHGRGWLLGTSGNLSAVVQREPLRLAMSPSGIDKGELTPDQLLSIDENARIVSEHGGKPSDESLLHIKIVKERGAGAVLHTHSIWNTILSDLYASDGGITIAGYEMLKGLEGVRTHEHSEWLPVIDNSQDMPALAELIGQTLKETPAAHGFLLRRHGLYSWGDTLAQAKRHIEILEFLLETMGRTSLITAKEQVWL
ncbi:MAG TPA: methylthioribulose 1-phosphate dehydratase [Pyrinomonadaceae bacterium]|nr:methylthioribulose 1-phosphate dehydratase [Pyrinomonadaceae bacterium]